MRNKSLLYLRKVVSSYSRKIKSCACFVVLDWYKLPSRDDHNIQPPIRPISHFCKTVLNFPSPQLHNHLPKNTPTGSSAHPASPDSMSTWSPDLQTGGVQRAEQAHESLVLTKQAESDQSIQPFQQVHTISSSRELGLLDPMRQPLLPVDEPHRQERLHLFVCQVPCPLHLLRGIRSRSITLVLPEQRLRFAVREPKVRPPWPIDDVRKVSVGEHSAREIPPRSSQVNNPSPVHMTVHKRKSRVHLRLIPLLRCKRAKRICHHMQLTALQCTTTTPPLVRPLNPFHQQTPQEWSNHRAAGRQRGLQVVTSSVRG
jgi:hypothetical protein